MTTIRERLTQLELASNNATWLVLDVTVCPTPEQAEQIEQATRTGRMCIAFYEPGQTAWIAGCSKPAPWEQQERSAQHG